MEKPILSIEQAQKAIEFQQWQNLQIQFIEFFGQGWDNVVFLINKNLVFRFAKNKEAEQFLLDENMILPALQNLFDLQIPNPIYFGQPTEVYPYHFHGYQILDGQPFYRVNFSAQAMQDCVIQLAQFLKKLHGIKAENARSLGAQFQIYDRTKVSLTIQNLTKRVVILKSYNVVVLDDQFIENMIVQASLITLDHSQDCLVHGDLDMRHLLVLDQKLSGVIDWGDMGINHPVIDLMVVFNILPVAMQELFFKEYGPVSDDVCNYARFLTLNRVITLMMSAHEVGDDQMFAVAHRSYQRLKKN